MKKIKTLFERDRETHLVVPQVTLGCEWVFYESDVMATRKLDGTCCLIHDGKLFKRYELRPGKPVPPGFALEEHDSNTGKSFGWVPVGDGPDDKWHREAFADSPLWKDGTYELCGPKVQGNPEGFSRHVLIPHGSEALISPALEGYDSIRHFLWAANIEGIVFYGAYGKMAKIKGRDFGFKRATGG